MVNRYRPRCLRSCPESWLAPVSDAAWQMWRNVNPTDHVNLDVIEIGYLYDFQAVTAVAPLDD